MYIYIYIARSGKYQDVNLIFMIEFSGKMLQELPKARNNLPITRHACSLRARIRLGRSSVSNAFRAPYASYKVPRYRSEIFRGSSKSSRIFCSVPLEK